MAILLIAAACLYYSLGETSDAAALVLALVPVLGLRWALRARSNSMLRNVAQATASQSEEARDGRAPVALRDAETPFQRSAGVLHRRWVVVVIAGAVTLLAAGLATGEAWMEAALAAVAFAIAAVPAGLPIVLTLFPSAAAWRLVSRGVVVRRLAALETLASTTVISIDDDGAFARAEAAGAVAECRRAGIRVVMVTDADKPAAKTVAEAANLPHDDASIVAGDELESLREGERESRVQRATIFARMSPVQKFLVVDGLQRAGAVVAMTGDGVDDGPALRRADVGIVGTHGTDASRAAADVVLRNDKLASIVDAIRAGRHVLQSSQRTVLFLVAFHLPIVVLAVMAPLAGMQLALLPIHLVWLGLLALLVSASIFPAEAPGTNGMRSLPRTANAPLVPGRALLCSTVSGGAVALGAWAAYAWRLPAVGEPEARAMALIVLLAGNQTLMFAERLALPGLGLGMIPRVRSFWVAWCASALSLGVVLYVPAVARVFSVEPPAAAPTLAALALGVLGVVWRFAVAPPQSPAGGAP